MQVAKEQTWSSATYSKNARFVSDLGANVLELLAPAASERILDLGCGDGVLTRRIADAGASVLGVDASDDFVASTRALGVDAEVINGEVLTFEGEFDAVFSNAALHWMTEADAVVAGVYRALKPGGRFVAEFGGHGNVAAIVTALRALADRYGIDDKLAHPWFFPTAEQYSEMLESAGFTVERAALIPRPTHLPSGLTGWIETFRAPFFHAAGSKADRLLHELEALLSPSLRDYKGEWTADYMRLRFIAHKK